MTREDIPGFDLYGELEISRLASAEVVEAAYRFLVKQHHPDVARPIDEDRIKRLNLAREWLKDPGRRRRYDAATSPTAGGAKTPSASRGRSRTTPQRDPASETPSQSFGVNADEVRHFLADLRGLDWNRALQVWDGRAVAHAKGYSRALQAAVAVGGAQRRDEWLFAREAASVIARGKLGDSTATDQILDVVADVAGAIAIRDLLPRRDYDLLVLPWMWRAEPVTGRTPTASSPAPEIRATSARTGPVAEPVPQPSVASPAAAAAAAAATVVPLAVTTKASRSSSMQDLVRRGPARRKTALRAGAVIVALVAVASALAGLNRPSTNLTVIGESDASLPAAAQTVSTSQSASTLGPGSPPPVGTGQPEPSPGGVAVGPTPTPRRAATRTPAPTPRRTASPTPIAAPTPTPPPTPRVICTVISLIDLQSSQAQQAWSKAGFSGNVIFSPAVPPHYRIQWQSLTVGASILCTSGITVRAEAP